MEHARHILLSLMLSLLGTPLVACGDDDDSKESDGEDGEDGDQADDDELDPQVPPANAAQMAGWLAQWESEGWEAEWVCESDPTAKTDGAAAIHVHNDADGKNRVCNNQRLAAAELSGDAEAPQGSASLKFVGDKIYVDVKAKASSDDGQGWYWYAPGGSPAGMGIAECTACHSAAGSDADHPGLGDYVYFQVQ